DVIDSGANVKVRVNGSTEIFPANQVTSVMIQAGDGNDTVKVVRTLSGVSTTVDLGGGDNVLQLAGNTGNLDDLPGSVAVIGGSGTDVVRLFDDNAPFSDTYTITNATLNRVVFGGLTYTGIEDLRLEAEPFDNTFNVF